MSLAAPDLDPIPAETIRAARAAFPKGSLAIHLRDHLGSVFTDTQFTDLFSPLGQPAVPPWRLALVSVLQFAVGLTDRQAAEAVRARIDWKDALALALTDPGFDSSVLCEFRARLLAQGREQHLLDTLLELCQQHGWLKARGQARTDSTHVLAASRVLGRLELAGETLRAALNASAVAAPDWLRALSPPEWFDRYSHRIEDYRLPKPRATRQAYAATMGADGQRLLAAVYAAEAPVELRALPAVEILRRVWVQEFVVIEGVLR